MLELPSKLPNIDPTFDAPFEGDKLNRGQYANTLRSIVGIYANSSCVLSINGEWGTGKTTFIKMWAKYMERLEYRTIYFNAWETDYISDPLVALLGELKNVVKQNEKFDEVCSYLGRIVVGTGSAIIGSVLEKTTGISAEAIKGAVSETSDIIKENIKDYNNQKATMAEFKKSLSEYVASTKDNEKLPVIFIIDELDRCNPHYAVKVLERVKHLFDIPNIFFVLPICKSQLEHSIQGFYGSDKVDSANYLRRFIDLEFELPAPEGGNFIKYLYEYYDFKEIFSSNSGNRRMSDNIEIFQSCAKRLFERTKIDLRTIDKIFVHCRIVAQQMGVQHSGEMDVVFLLCYLRILHFDVYSKIRSHSYTLQELLEVFERTFPIALLSAEHCDNMDYHGFLYTVADILYSYNQGRLGEYEKDVFPSNDDSELNFNCKAITKEKLKEALLYTLRNPYCRWGELKYLTNMIDLLQQLR